MAPRHIDFFDHLVTVFRGYMNEARRSHRFHQFIMLQLASVVGVHDFKLPAEIRNIRVRQHSDEGIYGYPPEFGIIL